MTADPDGKRVVCQSAGNRCDQEMCPFWTGAGCACTVFGIDEDEREAQKKRIEGMW